MAKLMKSKDGVEWYSNGTDIVTVEKDGAIYVPIKLNCFSRSIRQ